MRLTPPYFEVLEKKGEDHHPIFQVSCTFENNIEIGTGLSLKAAKDDAASKIVELLSIDHYLNTLENMVTYSVDSYNTPLSDIWNNDKKDYILTLKKKSKDQCEYKNFKVIISQNID
jgi:hypothetical protein